MCDRWRSMEHAARSCRLLGAHPEGWRTEPVRSFQISVGIYTFNFQITFTCALSA